MHNRHSTATPQHFGLSGFCVCVFSPVEGNVGWSLVRSVDVTPSRSLRKGVGGVRDSRDRVPKRVRDSRDRVSKEDQSSFPVKASGCFYKVQSSWPVKSDRTSEGFWHPVDLAHQRWDSEGVWKSSTRPGLSSPSDDRIVRVAGKVAQPT